MTHIQLVGISEQKSPDNKVWKLPYAFPIIIRQLLKTRHTFEHIDTHLHKLTYEETCRQILSRERQVYGISAWSHNYLQLKDMTARIRGKYPKSVIIVGGIISGNDNVVLRTTEADIVCTSPEGEFVLPEVMNCLDGDMEELREVLGISFMKNGELVRTGPRKRMNCREFDQQDIPAYEYFDDQLHEISRNLQSRKDLPIKAFPLLTTRGCPFRCTFCGHMYGRRLLRKSWPKFFDEVEFLVARYGFEGFFSNDTNMFLNKKDAYAYCEEYQKRGSTFAIIAELRLTFGDYAMFKKLNEHGVKIANFGLESGSSEMLKRMKKGVHLPKMKRIIAETVDAETMFHGNFIFGTPGENRKTIADTRAFMLFLERQIIKQKRMFKLQEKMCASGYGWTILLPSPTSKLYHEAIREGLISNEEWYLRSLSDEKFMELLKGSTFKISLAQEAGTLNMSEFPSRDALFHYIKFSINLVKFLARFLSFRTAFGNPLETGKLGICSVTHYIRFISTMICDNISGRTGYIPMDKRLREGVSSVLADRSVTKRQYHT